MCLPWTLIDNQLEFFMNLPTSVRCQDERVSWAWNIFLTDAGVPCCRSLFTLLPHGVCHQWP
jgi:hypothetical protein